MKGIVVDCLQDLVRTGFGAETWREIATRAGIDADRSFKLDDDLPDEVVLNMFAKTCEVANLSFEQACEVYGGHWVGTYMPRRHPEFYEGVRSTRELLLKLGAIHETVRQRMAGAQPPRHSYEWKDADTLLMGYHSERDLIVLFIGAIKGAARHFGDTVRVRQLNAHTVEIAFN